MNYQVAIILLCSGLDIQFGAAIIHRFPYIQLYNRRSLVSPILSSVEVIHHVIHEQSVAHTDLYSNSSSLG